MEEELIKLAEKIGWKLVILANFSKKSKTFFDSTPLIKIEDWAGVNLETKNDALYKFSWKKLENFPIKETKNLASWCTMLNPYEYNLAKKMSKKYLKLEEMIKNKIEFTELPFKSCHDVFRIREVDKYRKLLTKKMAYSANDIRQWFIFLDELRYQRCGELSKEICLVINRFLNCPSDAINSVNWTRDYYLMTLDLIRNNKGEDFFPLLMNLKKYLEDILKNFLAEYGFSALSELRRENDLVSNIINPLIIEAIRNKELNFDEWNDVIKKYSKDRLIVEACYSMMSETAKSYHDWKELVKYLRNDNFFSDKDLMISSLLNMKKSARSFNEIQDVFKILASDFSRNGIRIDLPDEQSSCLNEMIELADCFEAQSYIFQIKGDSQTLEKMLSYNTECGELMQYISYCRDKKSEDLLLKRIMATATNFSCWEQIDNHKLKFSKKPLAEIIKGMRSTASNLKELSICYAFAKKGKDREAALFCLNKIKSTPLDKIYQELPQFYERACGALKTEIVNLLRNK